ncbi:unnamed protein product [Tuwongella immobilis]|uniref:Uncharacterized protein n=1 Tax=Tuwongella immobilis TaxID=692036 RepID=A0A6C2YIC7_9BACT|nr:unnamed protein product [Tuwongella immobilis]VTR97068.1 unnamed protein product [Tuwongella immobilis]
MLPSRFPLHRQHPGVDCPSGDRLRLCETRRLCGFADSDQPGEAHWASECAVPFRSPTSESRSGVPEPAPGLPVSGHFVVRALDNVVRIQPAFHRRLQPHVLAKSLCGESPPLERIARSPVGIGPGPLDATASAAKRTNEQWVPTRGFARLMPILRAATRTSAPTAAGWNFV